MGELARIAFDVVLSSLAMAELARFLQLAIASSSLFWLLRGLPNLTSLAAIVIPSVGGMVGEGSSPWAVDDFYFFSKFRVGFEPTLPSLKFKFHHSTHWVTRAHPIFCKIGLFPHLVFRLHWAIRTPIRLRLQRMY